MQPEQCQMQTCVNSRIKYVLHADHVRVCTQQTAWTVWQRYLVWDFAETEQSRQYIQKESVLQNMQVWKSWNFLRRISAQEILWQKKLFWMHLLLIWHLDALQTVCFIFQQSHMKWEWTLRLISQMESVKRHQISVTLHRQVLLIWKTWMKQVVSMQLWQNWIRRDSFIQNVWQLQERQ